MKCKLVELAKEENNKNETEVYFVKDAEINSFLNDLKNYPHAFFFACLMNRRIKAERAWTIPYRIYKELGNFDIEFLASVSKEKYKKMFNDNSYHIYNDDASENFYKAVIKIKEEYDGDISRIWQNNPSSAYVVSKFLEFDGVGVKIATMTANILSRGFKLPMSDRYSIDISPDKHIRKIFTRLGYIKKGATTEQIIYKAREINPEYPGLIDLACWKIGREICHQTKPDCENCPLKGECKYYKDNQK